jgi:hypothetical protein
VWVDVDVGILTKVPPEFVTLHELKIFKLLKK